MNTSRRPIWLPAALACAAAGALLSWQWSAAPALAETPAATAGATVDYAKDVQPILQARCYECHGPEKQKGGFRADSKTHALQGGDSPDKPIVPGDVAKSHLLVLVRGDDPDNVMPPKGDRLTAAQIDVLTRWIQQGANWPDTGAAAQVVKPSHWSFAKPVKQDPPAVQKAGWARNPIDQFILAAQEKQGLAPSPEADKYSLIRRASLDLTGLPPTPQEVDAFVNDAAPDAYEKLIDRLLASPHYGERWARVWLDIARYADSSGYGSDPLRFTAWPYRDWVIKAFNRNLPYDQFTIEQLAGDLLPTPTEDQIIATGFHRNTMTNTEGGTDDEEWRVAAVKDRTNVTVQAWMGLTMGCTECHTHKYDPITQREYYSFFSFFNQTEDNDQPSEAPTVAVASPEQQQKLTHLNEEIAKLQAQMDDPATLAAKQAEWESTVRDSGAGWTVLDPQSLASAAGATLTKQPDGSVLASGTPGSIDTYTVTAAPVDLKGVTAFRVEVLPDPSLPAQGPGRSPNGNFVLNDLKVGVQPAGQAPGKVAGRFVRLEVSGTGRMIHIAELQAFAGADNVATQGAATQSTTGYDAPAERAIDGNTDGQFTNNSVTHTGTEDAPWWELDLKQTRELNKLVLWPRTDSGLFARHDGMRVSVLDESRKPVWSTVIAQGPQAALEIVPGGPSVVPLKGATATFAQGDFDAAEAVDADVTQDSGWAVAPQFGKPHTAVFEAAQDVTVEGGAALTFTLAQNYPQHSIGRFRISATRAPRPVRALPTGVAEAIALAPGQRNDQQKAEVTAYFKSIAPHLAPARERIAQLQRELAEVKPAQAAVMRELPAQQRRQTNLLVKGNFLTKGDPVEPTVPAALHAMPAGAPMNRLGVAMWVVDAENPLTARVAVNRFWASLFGSGIVLTQEDFGIMGQPPTHPELLDWMAVTFQRDLKWDMKALLKLIATSSTYRQSSKLTPDLLAKDPTNVLLTRAPRLRLEAEAVRDQALALSGLLSRKMHGPSVYPPQPPNLWQAAFNGERTYPTSTGEDKYRRGLYTFWRRTTPYPSMAAFDAPSREQCTVRRIHTSTPIQAFVTLNDPVYVEAAQALARRIAAEGGATPEERAAFALKLCLARPASPEQVTQVVALYRSEVAHYKTDAAAATAIATDPLGPLPEGADAAEMAAWTVVGNVLLNMDGVMTRG
jgi:mono/diheme cytochrome c family protein